MRTGKKQIKELKKSGITTLTQLAESTLTNVPNIPLNTFLTLKKQALLQLQSRRDEKIAYEIKNPSKGGLALLPPASINDVWFDIEGYPLVNGGLEYLFGVVEVDFGAGIFGFVTDFLFVGASATTLPVTPSSALVYIS